MEGCMTKEDVVAGLIAAGFVHQNNGGWANTYVEAGATEVKLAGGASRLTLKNFRRGSVWIHDSAGGAVLAATGATLRAHLRSLTPATGETTHNPSPAWRGAGLDELLLELEKEHQKKKRGA